jgi:hypothetical protein
MLQALLWEEKPDNAVVKKNCKLESVRLCLLANPYYAVY